MVTKVIIYCRVSTKDQADHGASLGTQLEECRKYTKEHRLHVVAEFSEDYSGTTLNRPQFSIVLQMLEENKADGLVIYTSDRLSRNYVDFLVLRDQFEQAGIQLHYVDRGQSKAGFEGLLTEGIMALLAHGEREKIIERSVRNKNKWARDGKVEAVLPHAPYGYDKVGGQFIINEFEAGVIKKIYHWYVYGDENGKQMGIRTIARKLNDLKVPTPSKRSTRANKWQTSTVSFILKNTIYVGYYNYGRTRMVNGELTKQDQKDWIRVDCSELAFVDSSLFISAQNKASSGKTRSRRNAKYPYLMQGHLRCAECGYLVSSKKGRHKDYYYGCSGRALIPPCSSSRASVKVDRVDQLVWSWLVWFLSDDQNINEAFEKMEKQATDIIGPAQKRLATIEKLLEKEEDYIVKIVDELGGSTSATVIGAIKRNIEEAENRIVLLKEEQEQLIGKLSGIQVIPETKQKVIDFAHSVRDRLKEVSFETMRYYIDVLNVQAKLHFEPAGKQENGKNLYKKWLSVSCGFDVSSAVILLDNFEEDAAFLCPTRQGALDIKHNYLKVDFYAILPLDEKFRVRDLRASVISGNGNK
jgi:site-specific DNA recombinase